MTQILTDADFAKSAAELDCEVAALRAVAEVAQRHGLVGWVLNTSGDVQIEVEE